MASSDFMNQFMAGWMREDARQRAMDDKKRRDLELKKRTAELRLDKINEQLGIRGAQERTAALQEGRPGPTLMLPNPDPLSVIPGRGPATTPQEFRHRPIALSPVVDPDTEQEMIPGQSIVPRSMDEVVNAAMQKAMMDPSVISKRLDIADRNAPVKIPKGLPGEDVEVPRSGFGSAVSAAARAQEGTRNRELQEKLNTRTNAMRIAAAQIAAAGAKANRNNALENALRDDYRGAIKDIQYPTLAASIERIQASAENPSPAGDLSMIFNYMKLLDPGSVVRETEFRTAETAKPLLERVGLSWNAVRNVWEGKRLTESQRADFLNRALAVYEPIERMKQDVDRQYAKLADDHDIESSRVVISARPGAARSAAGSVPMRTPDGKVWNVPADKVSAAKARGAVVVGR